MLQPLRLDVGKFGYAPGHAESIRLSVALGLPELVPAVCQHDGHVVLVGSGPSLPAFTDAIKAERALGRPICAINKAHDFLYEHDLIPDCFLTCDPRDTRMNITHANQQTVYLLSSRVPQEVFEHLKGRKIVLWHSLVGDDGKEESTIFNNTGKLLIGGGTTSGLRAINVFYMLGYRHFILYGMDSCLADDGKTKRFDGSQAGQIIDVIVGGRRFLANYAMAAQANEFQLIWAAMPDIHVEVKGDGLLAWIVEERKRMGKKV